MKEGNFTRLQLPRRAVALVLAGGRGTRLKDLTARRAKPAVYFGGKFRIIDFALSNCINSGIRRIGVITQYKSHSLLRHLQKGWSFQRWKLLSRGITMRPNDGNKHRQSESIRPSRLRARLVIMSILTYTQTYEYAA